MTCYEVVIDDWLDSGRSEQFACMASDKSGPSRYEHATKRHGEFSKLSQTHPSKEVFVNMSLSYAAQATVYTLFAPLVSRTTWVLLRALSFLMICRMCTFTVLSRIPSS